MEGGVLGAPAAGKESFLERGVCFLLLPVTPIHKVGPASPSPTRGARPEAASTLSPLPIKADIQRAQRRSLSLLLLPKESAPLLLGCLEMFERAAGGGEGIKREMPGERWVSPSSKWALWLCPQNRSALVDFDLKPAFTYLPLCTASSEAAEFLPG